MPPDETTTPAAPETPAPAAAPANEYAALKAAVEAAESEASPSDRAEDPPKPPTAKASPPPAMGDKPAAEAPAEPDPDADLPKISRLLRAREKARATETESRKAADDIVSRARAEATKFLEEARAAAKKELDEQRATYAKTLRENPFEFIKQHGVDRERLIDDVAREGTPEWQAAKRHERALDDMRNTVESLTKKLDEAEKRDQERARAAQLATIRDVERRFLATVTLDNAPNARKLYDDEEIVELGHRIARSLREQTGEDASLDDLRDELEYRAKKKAERFASAGTETKPKDATKKPAGTRTLTGASQSERRATPKVFREAKTPEEEAALLEEVAAAAMKGDG